MSLARRLLSTASFRAATTPFVRVTTRPPSVSRPPQSRWAHSDAGIPKLQSAAWHFKQQKHWPYFLEYLMWVVFGSEALHLMWLKMEYKEYKEKSQHKIKLLEEIIDRVEHGQAMDDNLKEEIRMVLLNGKRSVEPSDADIDEEYFNKLIASSEQAASEPVDQPTTTAETKPNVQPEPKSNWPPSDGRGEGKKKTFYL